MRGEYYLMNENKSIEILEILSSINKKVRKTVKFAPPFKGKNPSAMKILFHVMNGPPSTLKEISSIVGLANSTVCGLIDNLEREGYVKRVQDDKDRRRVIIIPTEKAIEEKKSVEGKFKNYLDSILKNVTNEDFETIITGLKRLDEIIDRKQ